MFGDFVEDLRVAMLYDNIELSYLMVHAKQAEETILKKNNKVAKRVSPFDRKI